MNFKTRAVDKTNETIHCWNEDSKTDASES